MANTEFLMGGGSGGPRSVEEAIFQLEKSSIAFLAYWQRVPPDLISAGRVSIEAMMLLDHVVNEILRARDALREQKLYAASALKAQLDLLQGLMVKPVTRAQQQAMINAGPGNGKLPAGATPTTLERLLTKIKHRQHGLSNFRIAANVTHFWLINVNNQNNKPDSIVEMDVIGFCTHCKNVAPLI